MGIIIEHIPKTAKPRERSNSELERLGMGIGRLGFGQTAGAKPAPKKMGFGAIGKPVQEEGRSRSINVLLVDHGVNENV